MPAQSHQAEHRKPFSLLNSQALNTCLHLGQRSDVPLDAAGTRNGILQLGLGQLTTTLSSAEAGFGAGAGGFAGGD